jgi:PAS domain S-box-containing protein
MDDMTRQPSTSTKDVAQLTGEVEALRREVERLRAATSKDRGLLQTILEQSPHGIIVCDAQGELILQNRAAEHIWAGSATAKDVDGWRSYRAFHPDGRPFEPQDWAMAKCLSSRSVIDAEEFHIQRFDDSYGYLLGSSAPIIGPEGELQGGISVFADITRLKESEAETHRLQSTLTTKLQRLETFAERASSLQKVTAAINGASTVHEIANILTAHGRELFGASASLLFLIEDDRQALQLCSFGGVAEPRVDAYRRVPLSANQPLAHTVSRAEPVWLGSHEQIVQAYPHLASVSDGGRPLAGVVTLPLRDARQIIGALAFSFYEPPDLESVQRDFYLTVASQCGLAIQRAQSFEAEKNARERLELQQQRLDLLARAGAQLSSSLHSRDALAELAKLAVPTLADWCAIDELDAAGQVRRLATEHRDPEKVMFARELSRRYGDRPNATRGVPEVLRTGKSEWAVDISDELLAQSAQDEEHLALLRSLQLTSYAIVPMKARGRVLGALTLVGEGTRRLSQDDLHIAEELASRAALALENARLYEAAEAARAQLHGLFMQAPAAICITQGREQRFELANEPYRRLVGRDDLVGLTMREALPQLIDQRVFERIEQVFNTGETFAASELQINVPARAQDGPHEGFFNVVCQATHDADGAVNGVATFAFEVTNQVLARRRLEAMAADVARSEARMRGLVEATAAIVWTATPRGEVVELSPSWLAFTGQTPDEYLNGGFLEAIHPDDRAPTMSVWTTAVGAGLPYAAEYRLRRHDGTYAHTLARGVPVSTANGTMAEYVGCNVDVSNLREAERAAREQADALAIINELGQVIAAELDQKKVVQAVTDAATSLTGAQFGAFFYNQRDDRGDSYMLYTISGVAREEFSKFPMPRNTAVFAPTFSGDGVVRSDDITQDPRYGKNAPYHGMPKGHLPVRSYLAVPVISRLGEVIGGLFMGHGQVGVFKERAEVLARGLAAQAAVAMDNARLFGEAQALIKALEATNRELDQFAYVTSHDLKAPLRGIGSLAEWLEEDLGPALNAEARRKLELLQRRVARMESLIEGILQFSRAGRTAGNREDVNVATVLEGVWELLAPKPPAALRVGHDMPVLRTERVALEQVFMNLVGNALKHARRPDVEIAIEVRDAGDAWEVRVSDNGPGIAPQYHERVFRIFQTLESRDKVESTGIGLAIVKKVIEGRGGRVWIESELGHGATFAFTWPKRDERRI